MPTFIGYERHTVNNEYLESDESKQADVTFDTADSTAIPASPAWNPQIDWSHSTVDISSDEESLPNSLSYTTLSASVDDDSSSESDFDDVGQSFQSERLILDPLPISTFRNRAHTFDGSIGTIRQSIMQGQSLQTEQVGADSTTRQPSSSFGRALSKISNNAPSIRLLILVLFSIATFTTFLLPYPDFSANVEKLLEKKELEGYFITSIATNNTSAVLEQNHVIERTNNEFLSEPSSHLQRGRRTVSYARRQNLKMFRKNELADFYRQKAIRQHQMIPWYVNSGILLSIGFWAICDWARKRRSGSLDLNTTC